MNRRDAENAEEMNLEYAENLIKELINNKDSSAYEELKAYGEEAIVPLISALQNLSRTDKSDANILLFCKLVSLLEAIKTPQAAIALAEFIKDEEVPTDNDQNDPRIFAIWALKEMGMRNSQIEEALITVLKYDSLSQYRCAAADALGTIGSDKALPALEWAAENELNLISGGGFDLNLKDKAKKAIDQIKQR